MDGSRSPRFFLHYLNREILSAYGATQRGERVLLSESLVLTRYALLASAGPLVVMPKFAFEVPYFRRYLWAIRPVVSAGLVQYVSEHPDFGYDIEAKQQQYSGQQHLFPSYFDSKSVEANLRLIEGLEWTPRKGPSATRAIEQAWQASLEADEAGLLTRIALEVAQNTGSVNRILRALEKVPTGLDGKAFILSHVLAILPLRFSGAHLTAMNFLINSAYLRLYLEAHDVSIFIDTSLGELDCGLRAEADLEHRLVSFATLRRFARSLGIGAAIERGLSWSDLVELREDLVFRWFFRLGVLGATGDEIATQLAEDALRESGVYARLRQDTVCSFRELRDYLRTIWEAVERRSDIAALISQYDFALAARPWMQRRLRGRMRMEDNGWKDTQLALPLASTRSMNDTGAEHMKVSIAVITVREDEFGAVLRRFSDRKHFRGHRYYEIARTTRRDNGQPTFTAILRLPAQGNLAALDATRDVIEDLDPDAIVLIGIGGGLPSSEYTLGDVIVATSIHDLRVRAVIQGGDDEYASSGAQTHKAIAVFLAHLPAFELDLQAWSSEERLGCRRPTMSPPSILETDVYGSPKWIKLVRDSLEKHFDAGNLRVRPWVIAGALASSDTLVKDADYAEDTRSFIRQVLGFEMEAAGVFEAAGRPGKQYPVLVVRGISDIVGLKRDPRWTAYACESAASFLYELVASGLLNECLET